LLQLLNDFSALRRACAAKELSNVATGQPALQQALDNGYKYLPDVLETQGLAAAGQLLVTLDKLHMPSFDAGHINGLCAAAVPTACWDPVTLDVLCRRSDPASQCVGDDCQPCGSHSSLLPPHSMEAITAAVAVLFGENLPQHAADDNAALCLVRWLPTLPCRLC
jgi:hypothetical protein